MNANRRKALAAIITRLEELDSMREEIREQLQDVMDEEKEALDNIPESLQESDRCQQMQGYIDTMQDVIGELDLIDITDLQDQLQEITEV